MTLQEKKEKLRELIGTALGQASMCWTEIPKGVFESTKARIIMETLIADLIILDVHDIAKCARLEQELLVAKQTIARLEPR